ETTTREFEISSEEGLPIRGVIEIPRKAERAAIVVHGFKGFKDWGFFPWLCERLSESGIAACRFDMSRNGIGNDPETFERLDLFADDTYSISLSDLAKVVEYVRSLDRIGSLPMFLVGHSRGGAVALLGSRRIEGLSGVVTWSAISSADRWDEQTKKEWREKGHLDIVNSRTKQIMRLSTAVLDDLEKNRDSLDVLSAVRSLTTPLLVIHGADDETVSSDDARAIVEASDGGSLMIVGRASHTFNAIHPLVNVPPELELVGHVTARFITAYR
ncbi:MAG: alpha/beta fold hydrolase, partial [Thermoanaerobaculia bacterium]|nr:alpha/beta fold hydrolase [Thermoanaerobaculia bacterium]